MGHTRPTMVALSPLTVLKFTLPATSLCSKCVSNLHLIHYRALQMGTQTLHLGHSLFFLTAT